MFTLYSKTPQNTKERTIATYVGGDDTYYEYGKYTTESDGKIYTTNSRGERVAGICDLPWDSYYLVETQAPAGYAINQNNVYPFVVDQYHNLPDSMIEGSKYMEEHLMNAPVVMMESRSAEG